MKKLLIILSFSLSTTLIAQTRIGGFANFNTQLQSNGLKDIRTEFQIGELDMFVTSKIDNVYFLSELVTTIYGSTEFTPDIERLILGYKFSDEFQLQCGKIHTPIGFWNNKFHHGTVIQPTIARPDIINFEDAGNTFMPIHQVGVEVKGSKLTDFNLGYDIVLANGISSNNINEINPHKSIIAKIFAQPIDGLEVSLSGVYDKLDSGNVNTYGATMTASTMYNMVGAGVSYFNIEKRFEFAAEYYFTQARNSNYADKASGGFVYVGYSNSKFKHYTLGNLIFSDQKSLDPFYANGNKTNITLGTSYQLADMAVFKLEVKNNFNTELLNNQIKLQFALGF